MTRVIDELSKIAEMCGYHHKSDYEAKEEGYYAAHFYLSFPCDVPDANWETRTIAFAIELQVTTQLQEAIKKVLHQQYEHRRVNPEFKATKWQWDYRSSEFATNYLGHILHYVEGMIMDVRSKGQSTGDKK